MSESSEEERIGKDIQEPEYIERAMKEAWTETSKGQYYSLTSSLMALFGIGCSLVCWGLFKLFGMFGDKTLRVRQYLQGMDFVLDADTAYRGKLGVVRPSFAGGNINPADVHF